MNVTIPPEIDFDVTSAAIATGLCLAVSLLFRNPILPGFNPDLANGNIDFYLGPDANVITYTNRAK